MTKSKVIKCCGAEITTPFCPYCGKSFDRNNPLAILKYSCKMYDQKVVLLQKEGNVGNNVKNVDFWKAMIEVLVTLFIVNAESDWDHTLNVNIGAEFDENIDPKKHATYIEAIRAIRRGAEGITNVDSKQNTSVAGKTEKGS